LLDVNVLLALLDQAHVFHQRAREWLMSNADTGWASCPITENGFVRIISQPKYPQPITSTEAIALLQSATVTSLHEFWPADVSLLDSSVVDRSRVHGPRQLTDLYLLALAVARGGRLVTFDGAIPLSAVRGATSRHLETI
jgi:hypothetical protein